MRIIFLLRKVTLRGHWYHSVKWVKWPLVHADSS